MRRRSRTVVGVGFVAAALSALLFPLPAISGDTVTRVLFPASQFANSHGWESRSFNVPASQGTFTLCVINGDGSGGHRVSSGTIKVNGVTVVSPSDLNQNVYHLDRYLTNLAQGANTLEVNSGSGASAYITVTITAEYLLDVAITDPPAGAALR